MFELLQLKYHSYHKLHKFKTKVRIHAEKGPFVLKTVTTSEELFRALRLRSRKIHLDPFDLLCDHIIVIDKRIHQVVGTYRLNSSLHSKLYCSANEFNLRRVLEIPGPHLELSRVFIQKDFAHGLVTSLLWQGIAEYMAATQSSLLFGCASIRTQSPRQAALLYHHFANKGLFQSEFSTSPSLNYAMPSLDLWISNLTRPLSLDEVSEAEGLIPSHLTSYLKAGAFLGGKPAYDEKLQCIDFLTILPRENLNRSIWRKDDAWTTNSPLDFYSRPGQALSALGALS